MDGNNQYQPFQKHTKRLIIDKVSETDEQTSNSFCGISKIPGSNLKHEDYHSTVLSSRINSVITTAQTCFGTPSHKAGSGSGNTTKPTAVKSGLPFFKSDTIDTDAYTGARSATVTSCCRNDTWYPDPSIDPGRVECTTATATTCKLNSWTLVLTLESFFSQMLPIFVTHLGAQGTILSSEELPLAPQIFTGLIIHSLFPGGILPTSQAGANPNVQDGRLPAGQAGVNPAIQGTPANHLPIPSSTDDDFAMTTPAGIQRSTHAMEETTTESPNGKFS
ncbi:Amelotin [Plecturocebus cupreus]